MTIDEKTLTNIKKVSLIFFIGTGLLHLGSSMLIANQLYLKESLIVNRTMDIPLLLTGLLYGFSSIRLSLTDTTKEHKVLDIFLSSIIILALTILIVVNLVFDNLN